MTSLSMKYLILADFPVKIGLNGGQGGVPQIFFDWNLTFYVTWEPPHKFGTLSGIYLKIAHFPVKIGLIRGVGGGSPKFFLLHWNPPNFVT